MATKADFSQEEWEAMQKGITGAGMLVAISDRGIMDAFKEANALASTCATRTRRATARSSATWPTRMPSRSA